MSTSLRHVTRRKLIKTLRSWGEDYYVLTDGSSVVQHDTLMHDLDRWPKDRLIKAAFEIIRSVTACVEQNNQHKLIELVTLFVERGIIFPQSWEMPTEATLRAWAHELSVYVSELKVPSDV